MIENQFAIRKIDELSTNDLLATAARLRLLTHFSQPRPGYWRVVNPCGETYIAEQKFIRFYVKGLLHASLIIDREQTLQAL